MIKYLETQPQDSDVVFLVGCGKGHYAVPVNPEKIEVAHVDSASSRVVPASEGTEKVIGFVW